MLPAGYHNTSYRQDAAIVRTRLQWIFFGLFLVCFSIFPLFLGGRWLAFLIMTGITIIALHGLNIILGYCGQISIGHIALMAIGGYTSALLVSKAGVSFFLTLPLAGIAGMVVAMLFGSPSLKIKGFYLAVATLAMHFIVMYVITRVPLFGGTNGVPAPRATIAGFALASDIAYYYLVFGISIVMTFFATNIARCKTGRAFIAIRDNDLAAGIMGVNVFWYKVLAFGISGFYAAVAGALLVHYYERVTPEYFILLDGIWFLGVLVIGGMGSVMGVIFGAFFFRGVEQFIIFLGPFVHKMFPSVVVEMASGMGLVIWSLIIIFFIVYEPRGINHMWEILKSHYRLHPFSY